MACSFSIPCRNHRALADVDAVIVDAATLRLAEKPPLFDLKAIERWQVPTVWIDDMESPAAGGAPIG